MLKHAPFKFFSRRTWELAEKARIDAMHALNTPNEKGNVTDVHPANEKTTGKSLIWRQRKDS